HVLRGRLGPRVWPSGVLCRPHSARRQADQPSGTGSDKVRDSSQYKDGQGAWLGHTSGSARSCRRGDRVKRRDFITLIGGAAAWPLAARAQEPSRTYHLGFVVPSGRDAPPIMAFFDELRRNGFIEGQNLSVVEGGFNVREDQAAGVVEALVKTAPDVIVSSGMPTRILQRATRTIPIVAMSEDMLADGIVASLARPEGNTTGVSILSPE